MSSQQTNALSHSSAPCGLTNSFHGITTAGLAVIVVLCLIAPSAVRAQAPGLVWSTNVGARIFAVDGADNLYATAGNTVIVLNGAGVPQSTNTICPIGGVAQRDSAGNFYFAGSFDGTQNFGGITLVGGWTNWPTAGHWSPGYPTCYLAKYTSAGSLLWVTSFGQQSYANHLSDALLDGTGSCYAAYWDSALEGIVAHISKQWFV